MWRLIFIRWRARRVLRLIKKLDENRLAMWYGLDKAPSMKCAELAEFTLRTSGKTLDRIKDEAMTVLDETWRWRNP